MIEGAVALIALAVVLLIYRDLRRATLTARLGSEADIPVIDPDHMRVHLFSGDFADEAELDRYCYGIPGTTGPEPLNVDLPEAPLNTDYVEAAYGGDIDTMIAGYFGRSLQADIRNRLAGDPALVLVFEAAFEGLSYRLHDTPRLRHLGYETLDLPQPSEGSA